MFLKAQLKNYDYSDLDICHNFLENSSRELVISKKTIDIGCQCLKSEPLGTNHSFAKFAPSEVDSFLVFQIFSDEICGDINK